MSENSSSELLIIDDDVVTRELSALQLSTLGYRVSLADSGLRALELIATRRFHLVLLDIDMPGMTGLDVVAEIADLTRDYGDG